MKSAKQKHRNPPEKQKPARRLQDGLDPSKAPEEEGSATQTKQKGDLLRTHKTDESGAPVD